MTYIIRDMPVDDRPRERLLTHGPEVLSDAELLAVVLGTGTLGKNAIYLARELLMGDIGNLRGAELTTLTRTRGMGPAKAARIAAVVEMSRRLANPPEPAARFNLDTLARKLVRRYGAETQERFGAALLDARHRVIKQKEIFVGTQDRALVSTRDITRFALLERAVAVVIYHNHPSGDPTPSDDDVKFTKQLQQSLALMDLCLVDHLVIGAHRYASLKQRGDLKCEPS